MFILNHLQHILPVGAGLLIYFVYSMVSKPKALSSDSVMDDKTLINSIEILNAKLASGEITKAEYLRKKELLK